ncbi:Na(+)/H(+) antiporter subunit C [Brevibacterium daeguense]|uniref:Na(+)/H(+) antiporter subunit C n=1 Tax=Brevibacterium daeguense TaxID=909936 RepID=A0ABP8EI09_9MICO
MTTSFVMLLAMGVMFACGLYLMLDRSLTRVLLGFLLMGNATNILIMLTAGGPGRPPITDGENLSAEGMNDPLPHALILTAIVITFSLSAFLLAMIYRSWRLVRNENLEDDIEDAKIALTKYRSTGEEAGTSGEYDDTEFGDEAQTPIPGALDLDEDGSPRERLRGAGDGFGEAVPENPTDHAEKENMTPEELDRHDEEGGR